MVSKSSPVIVLAMLAAGLAVRMLNLTAPIHEIGHIAMCDHLGIDCTWTTLSEITMEEKDVRVYYAGFGFEFVLVFSVMGLFMGGHWFRPDWFKRGHYYALWFFHGLLLGIAVFASMSTDMQEAYMLGGDPSSFVAMMFLVVLTFLSLTKLLDGRHAD